MLEHALRTREVCGREEGGPLVRGASLRGILTQAPTLNQFAFPAPSIVFECGGGVFTLRLSYYFACEAGAIRIARSDNPQRVIVFKVDEEREVVFEPGAIASAYDREHARQEKLKKEEAPP